MDKLKVAELKTILKSRGLSCKGNKAVLLDRLINALGQSNTSDAEPCVDNNAVRPIDSMSDVHSESASTSHSNAQSELKHAEEAADRAALVERLKSLKEKQYIESQIAELRRGQELLEIQATLNELTARDRVLKTYRHDDASPFPASFHSLHSHDTQHVPPTSFTHTRPTPRYESTPCRHHLTHDSSSAALIAERERTAALMRLPPIEIKKFGGDITQFAQFIRSFEMKIASKLDDDREKLHYLEQNLIPGCKPHTIVESCMYLEDGYQQAMQILNKRYGQRTTIAAAFMDRIASQQQLSADNGEALDKFSLLLLSCKNALGNDCSFMSDPRTLRNITVKLPTPLLHRWRRRADDLEENQGRPAVFEDLVDFVVREARIATNASFGQHMYDSQQADKTKQFDKEVSRRYQKPFVAVTNSQAGTNHNCLFCGEDTHSIVECTKLNGASTDERRNFVMSNALCFGCLRKGHRRALCRTPATCQTCHKNHPTALHESTGRDRQKPLNQTQIHQNTGEASATSCRIATIKPKGGAVLPLVAVKVHSRCRQITTYAFLDSGSTHSFISTSLLSQLDIEHLPSRQLALTTVDRAVSVPTRIAHDLSITDLQGGNELQLPPLYSLASIPVDPSQFPHMHDVERWTHLQDVTFPDSNISDVGLLLGANAFLAMEPLKVIPSAHGSPYATLTRFGWIVSGLNQRRERTDTTAVFKTTITANAAIEDMIKSLYNHEYEESLHCTQRGLSAEDRLWLQTVENSISHFGHHYSISLPLADKNVELPNNVSIARSRLNKLKVRLERDQQFASDYKTFMSDMLEKGIAEVVPKGSENRNDGRVWVLPHHAVYHPHKPDKIRVVFDCAAQFQGISLNDCLLQGPDQTNTLLDVLLRFRMERIAFIADIEGMFNQVYVHEADRDFLRFLWWQDGNTSNEIQQLRMKVHIFGAKSSPSVACYALRRTAEDNKEDFSEEAIETIKRNFYVDDVLKSASDEQTAVRLVHELKELCSRGGFNLTKMSSNSQAVVNTISPDDKSKTLRNCVNSDGHRPDEKALGIVWKTEEDVLSISLDIASLKSRQMTRRGLLSAVSCLYDPLGMIAPTILRGKKILQDLARKQFSWELEIPEEDQQSWLAWLADVSETSLLSIARCIKPTPFEDIASFELHHFADASETAYGTVSYVRIVDKGGAIYCSFLKGKAHLAPLKTVTIPRLELMAAVTAVRVSALLSHAITYAGSTCKITQEFFWTDSTTVLRYIANKKTRFHTFVANRLAIIHDGSTQEQWMFVPSELNPADDVSRGDQSNRWLKGPEFLWKSQNHWPKKPVVLLETQQDDPEVKTALVTATGVIDDSARNIVNAVNEQDKFSDPIQRLISHYSDRRKLVRAVAWILKTKEFLKSRVVHGKGINSRLTSADLWAAEEEIFKTVQANAFSKDLAELQAGKSVRPSSKLYKLDPFLKDGLLRVGGRLKNAEIAYNAAHPVILPSHGNYIDMLVRDAHQRSEHAGRQHVLTELRNNFWILKGNATVRRILKSCVFCKKRFHQPEVQKCANLPEDRVKAFEKPFTRTGVDYFGPFYVRHGRGQIKHYGVLFTCLSVRAIHIEVADDLSSDSFICALKRFVCRRGRVKMLRSDKGTNFVGANNELKQELQRQEQNEAWIHYKVLAMSIDWVFNVAGASHHGGAWERQIRSVRRILEAIITSAPMKAETLRTFMCEVEYTLNSRPLTPLSADPRDTTPLSPNHILFAGNGYDFVPTNIFDRGDCHSRKRWKQAAFYADMFWKRWRAEYLPFLQERSPKFAADRQNFAVGDVALIVDSSVPRGQWPLGRVSMVKHSAEGLVRSAVLNVKGTTLERPVTKLVKITQA